jgi:hypothetical protein
MATTSSRVLSLFIAVLVGALPACRTVHPPFDAEGTNAILVGPGAKDLSIPNAYLWKDATHDDTAVWVSLDSKKILYIDFKDEIFEGMQRQPDTGRYRVQCQGSRCDSGHIRSDAAHNTPHVYWQTLVDTSGNAKVSDGMIIIKP